MREKRKHRFWELFSRAKIRKQLYGIYIIAVFFPIVIIGSFLLGNTYRLLTNYYQDLLESDNLRVKTILMEITTQIYNISEVICFEDALQDLLNTRRPKEDDAGSMARSYATIDNYISSHPEIEDITIYTDNPYAGEYIHFAYATLKTRGTEWYGRAAEQVGVFWMPMERVDKYGNSSWNLCLVRKVPVIGGNFEAVLVIKISDNYLETRIGSNEYRVVASGDNGRVFFSSAREGYGEAPPVYIDNADPHYHYLGPVWEDADKLLTDVSTLQLYQSESVIYVTTMSEKAYADIRGILMACLVILLVAIVLPAFIVRFFTGYFTGRVNVLRGEMGKASGGDYDIMPAFRGEDELSEAFADLQIMVQKIKEKDAKMYEAKLGEQQLLNEQQVMEMKMLASQINPHFLYNTLESIRMQALTSGNREVANSIRLLGKSMRYVLENTGTASVPLSKELDYVETYLTIQRIRFGDRVNYSLEVEEGLEPDSYLILPLLLQPVTENAILHGLEEKEEDGRIKVAVSLRPARQDMPEEECLEIVIFDNGCGMNGRELEELREKIREQKIDTSSSIGLSNINRRIRLCYGKAYGMEITSGPGEGTEVTLLLPVKRAGVRAE